MEQRLTRRRLKELASLSRSRRREEAGQTFIEGIRAVEAAVDGGATLRELVVVHSRKNDNEVRRLEQVTGVVAVCCAAEDFVRISDVKNSQGVLAVVDTRWTKPSALARLPRLVALDGVQDPGNVGTIVRTAAWFGIDGILAGSGTADLFSPKVLRATMGGIWDLAVARTEDLPASLTAFKEGGHRIVAAAAEGVEVGAWSPQGAVCLVLGSEGAGIASAVRGLSDEAVWIGGSAGRRGTESLNVAVASAVIMHHRVRSPKTVA